LANYRRLQVPPKTIALRMQGLAKTYRGALGRRSREVLCGVDLLLQGGELCGLLGPNGSGKTTLLRIAAGLEPRSAGVLEVLGATPASAAVRRRLGFLSELSPFPPELRALAALELMGALQGLARAERKRRAAAWLERVGLDREAREPLGRFSKGMLRRFGLAQALQHDPALLLLDEPGAGLDAEGALLLGELLDEALARGTAVLIASHALSEVFERAAHLCVLLAGRVAVAGAPADLAERSGSLRLEIARPPGMPFADVERLLAASGARVTYRGPGSAALLEIYRAARGPLA
jgi:ABC-type multidrug transport system ATPase subunit